MLRYFIFLLALVSCNNMNKKAQEKPVARVFDLYFYPSDLDRLIPDGVDADDSARIARRLTEEWVREKLLLNRAEQYLSVEQKDVQKQIEESNKDLPLPAKIHRFVNLYKVFDADDEELTRTSKLKRAFVESRYKDIVDALYSDADSVHMDTTITYEDGREQRIKTDLRIQDVIKV